MRCVTLLRAFRLFLFLIAMPASAQDPEALATAAEQEGRLQEALGLYLQALQALPDPPPSEADLRIRKQVAGIVGRLGAPPVPEEAIRLTVRGTTAFKDASSERDYADAALEFRQAVRAMRDQIRAKLYELEYRQEQKAKRLQDLYAGRIPEDLEEAVALFAEACEAGDRKACDRLVGIASRYCHGQRGAQDVGCARDLREKACSHGSAWGCYEVGHDFEMVWRVNAIPDALAKRLRYYGRSCELTSPGSAVGRQACIHAAELEESGKNTDAALRYYEKACALGDNDACRRASGLRR